MCHACNVLFVCNDDDGVSGAVDIVEEGHDFMAGLGVEITGGFVGENNGRVVYERTRHCNTLTLSAGKFVGLMVHALAKEVNMPDRGARVARFRVLRSNENPAVLMECGYLSSAKEASLIVQDGYRERIAEGIVKGLIGQRGGPLLQLASQ